MERILKDLADRLHDLRLRANRVTLKHVLDSAKILQEAREIAQGEFGRWVRERAHMQYETARRYLRVAVFVQTHHNSNSEIATLSLAKIYALSSLDSDTAQRFLAHREAFSKPLSQLTDVEFLREFRQRYPKKVYRRTRLHFYREIAATLTRLRKALARGQSYAARLTSLQGERISRELEALGSQAPFWKSRKGATG
ncbi:MAG TPA: hypothetical protein VF950_18575 [Planctomycetota bacterium]